MRGVKKFFKLVLKNFCIVFVQFEDPGINQTAEYINMPVYPEQGSIQYINDVLVVKLSQE